MELATTSILNACKAKVFNAISRQRVTLCERSQKEVRSTPHHNLKTNQKQKLISKKQKKQTTKILLILKKSNASKILFV